jgi:putative transcriptional regulator
MTAKARKKFRSRIAEAAYETASGLNRIGLIDARTMREFDAACLTTIEPLTGKQILALRGREGVSQGVFARVLNAKPKLVSEWERSETKPSGSSLKLFSIAKAHGHAAIS